VLPLLGDPISLAVVIGINWATGPAFNVLVGQYRYAITPDRLLARTLSVARFVAWGTIPVGTMLGGFLVGAVGPVLAFAVLAGAMTSIAVAFSLLPSVRRAPQADYALGRPG
jgi:hypothetical protein